MLCLYFISKYWNNSSALLNAMHKTWEEIYIKNASGYYIKLHQYIIFSSKIKLSAEHLLIRSDI